MTADKHRIPGSADKHLADWRFDDATGDSLAATTVDVGVATELFESTAGSTALRNTAGKPINIQLYPSARAYLSDNTTATTIDAQNTWYQIEGAWDAAHLNLLTHDGSGGLTYDGDVTTQVQYQTGGTYNSPDNNAGYEIAMFKDGSVKERTIMPFSPARQDEDLGLPTLIGFTDTTTPGMTHDLRVRCTTGATNITVTGLSFTLRG
jgi:hypothetical protein